MQVKVRLFAIAREIVGHTMLRKTLPDGSTLSDFSEWLFSKYPAIENAGVRFAVNMAYVPLETMLNDADEIACIPPVGGG